MTAGLAVTLRYDPVDVVTEKGMVLSGSGSGSDWLVVCLCAEWCGVCRDYLARFEQVQALFPQVRFVWVDVEDQSDLVDPVEVDDFPTVLIARGDAPVFFGTVRPQVETLDRLVRDRLAGATKASAPVHRDVAALVSRLRVHTG